VYKSYVGFGGSQDKGRRRFEMKKLVIAGIIMVTVVVAAGAAFYFGLKPAKDTLLENASAQIRTIYGIDTKVSDIKYVMPSAISLNNVAVTVAETGSPIMEAESIRAELAPLLLLKGGIGIKRVICEGGVFHYERAENGSSNIDRFLGRNEGGGKHRAITLALKDSRMIFVDRKINHAAEPVAIDISEAVISSRSNGSTKINVASARFGNSDFSLKGVIGKGSDGVMSLVLSSAAFNVEDLKTLISSVAGIDTSSIKNLESSLTVRIDVKGGTGKEEVIISAASSEGKIGADALESFKLKGAIRRHGIELDTIRIKLASGGSANGFLKMPLSGNGESEINLKTKDFPVGIVSDVIEGWNPGITGNLTANAKVKGSFYDVKSLKGDCDFNAVEGHIPDMIEGESMNYENIQGGFDISDGSLTLKKLALRSEQMDMDLKGSVGLERGDLNLKGRAEVAKNKVRSAGVKKIVAGLLPDGDKGYVFNMRIEGNFGAPEVKFSPMKTVYRGVEDKVKDSANSVEKFIKKIF